MNRKRIKEQAARYTKFVEWSDKDSCFVGSAPPLIGPCCHGRDEAKVYAELCRIVEEWVEILKTDGSTLPAPLDGKKFSGKFVLLRHQMESPGLPHHQEPAGDALLRRR